MQPMYYIGLDVHKNLKKVKKVRRFRRCPRDPLLSMPDNSVSRQFGVPNFVLTTKALLIIELGWHQNKNDVGDTWTAGSHAVPF
jgi:hypothetical protein